MNADLASGPCGPGGTGYEGAPLRGPGEGPGAGSQQVERQRLRMLGVCKPRFQKAQEKGSWRGKSPESSREEGVFIKRRLEPQSGPTTLLVGPRESDLTSQRPSLFICKTGTWIIGRRPRLQAPWRSLVSGMRLLPSLCTEAGVAGAHASLRVGLLCHLSVPQAPSSFHPGPPFCDALTFSLTSYVTLGKMENQQEMLIFICGHLAGQW